MQDPIKALEVVVEFLDNLMAEKPDRQLADVSNYLQQLLDDLKTSGGSVL